MRTLLAALGLTLFGLCHAQTNPPPFTVTPANPTVMDEITIERSAFSSNCDYSSSGRVSLRMANDVLDVTYLDSPPGCGGPVFGPIPAECTNCNLKFRLGPLPAGTFTLRLASAHGDIIGTQTLTVTQTAAAGGVLPAYDYGDSYWTAAESGWVLHLITSQSRHLVGILAVYDQANRPVWYFLPPGTWVNERRYETKVFKTSGSFFGSTTYQEGPREEVGTMTMEFAPWNGMRPQMQLSYIIEGFSKTFSLTRQSF